MATSQIDRAIIDAQNKLAVARMQHDTRKEGEALRALTDARTRQMRRDKTLKKLEQKWLAGASAPFYAYCDMTFDGGGWTSKIPKMFGINSIPRAVLVDGDTGLILDDGSGLRGENLAKTIEKALEKKSKK